MYPGERQNSPGTAYAGTLGPSPLNPDPRPPTNGNVMLIRTLLAATIIMATSITTNSEAQHPRPPVYRSVEVHPDRTVTFRILAPQAKAVSLRGEIAENGPKLFDPEHHACLRQQRPSVQLVE